MSKLYHNTNQKEIKTLMKEIGVYRYEQALENMKVKHKPAAIKGWFLESNQHCLFLCYRYPSGNILKLVKIERFKNMEFI